MNKHDFVLPCDIVSKPATKKHIIVAYFIKEHEALNVLRVWSPVCLYHVDTCLCCFQWSEFIWQFLFWITNISVISESACLLLLHWFTLCAHRCSSHDPHTRFPSTHRLPCRWTGPCPRSLCQIIFVASHQHSSLISCSCLPACS